MYPTNHGKVWDAASYVELLLNFWHKRSIDEIAHSIGRKRDAVYSRLETVKLCRYHINGDFIEEQRDTPYTSALIEKFMRQMEQTKGTFALCLTKDIKNVASLWLDEHSEKYLTKPETVYMRFVCQDKSNSLPVLQFEGETEMPKFFENNYLLNGKNLAAMSNSDIYAAIAAEEQAVNNLRQIGHKPKRLEKEIYNRSKSLKEFIEFLDKLDEPKEE